MLNNFHIEYGVSPWGPTPQPWITKKYTAIKKDTKLKNPCILIRQTNPHPYEIAESEETENVDKCLLKFPDIL